VKAYGQAARRAKAVGFDGVQLHGAHGYLISQTLSPQTNERTDRWGGSFDNRLNFLRAVCDEVRNQVGADFPMFIKLASEDFVTGGLTAKDTVRIAERLAGFGLEAIEISGGIQAPKGSYNVRPGIKNLADEGYFLENARRFRDATDLPLILVGGFRTPELIERMVTDEGMDFVSLCRPLINDPDLPKKWQAGSDERAGCISCNLCLRNRYDPLRCWYKYPKAAPQA
jgi:2,4-dienoyl-CoA reductase-like NADH-dependent reductase (Old Yellow Enzyme family)